MPACVSNKTKKYLRRGQNYYIYFTFGSSFLTKFVFSCRSWAQIIIYLLGLKEYSFINRVLLFPIVS